LDDGTLVPRSQKGAVIEEAAKAVDQILQLLKKKSVTTQSGKEISVKADTICIHGDNAYAPELLKIIHQSLIQNQFVIKAFLFTMVGCRKRIIIDYQPPFWMQLAGWLVMVVCPGWVGKR
jgi:hypothetical protein